VKIQPLALTLLLLIVPCAFAKTLPDKQVRAVAAKIDSLLLEDLNAANLSPLERIDDGTFIRRSYLGIVGRIPTEDEARSFLADTSPDKRARLINILTASPGFDSHLFNWTADLLRVQTNDEEYGLGWHTWLRASLAKNKPWDEIVHDMLASTGHASDNPAVGYYLRDRNMQLDNFSNSMQVFLGQQIGCAQCHDHPFDDLSQYNYYQMAAFSGGTVYASEDARETVTRAVREKNGLAPSKESLQNMNKRERRDVLKKSQNEFKKTASLLRPIFRNFNRNAVYENPKLSLRLPDDYKYNDAKPGALVPAETLFGEQLAGIAPTERRESFAGWVTSEKNPFFTKVIANRLWERTFGHGLLDPVDNWKEDSKPAHPKVLEFLEETMKAVDYDLREFSRILYHTNLFQRECDLTEPELGNTHLVRGPTLRRMTAEQLYDSMIVLKNGTINDSPSAKLDQRWQQYTLAVDKMLNAETDDLMILAEATSQAEDEFREARGEMQKFQRAIAEADTKQERFKAVQASREVREKFQKMRLNRDPLKMIMAGENTMTADESPSMGSTMMSGNNRHNNGKGAEQSLARASEFPAPFNPATLVREFGGSDRESPSSGNTIPTVPQALALLNDRQTDIIGGKKSRLGKRLASIDNAQERLETVFLCLYSRLPSSEEADAFEPIAKNSIELRDLTRAMLTSNRFIFIR